MIGQSLLGKSVAAGVIELSIIYIRDYATDPHRMTDDRPYGGGPGMVMKVEPIDRAVSAWKTEVRNANLESSIKVLLTSASGPSLKQSKVKQLSTIDALGIICGHYEGVDQRVMDLGIADEEVRIGDFVLSGGEPAAACILDAVARLQQGFMGNEQSTIGESHDEEHVGSFPQFTRPEQYRDQEVPPVLLSGNHQSIADWRLAHRKQLD